MLSEPGSVYIGHVISDSGSSVDITQSIIQFFILKRIKPSELVAIDETNVNVGKKNGIVRRLESFVGHKFNCFVRLLHLMNWLFGSFFRKLTERHLGHNTFPKCNGNLYSPLQLGKIGEKIYNDFKFWSNMP